MSNSFRKESVQCLQDINAINYPVNNEKSVYTYVLVCVSYVLTM